MRQISYINLPKTNDYIKIYKHKYMNRNINMKNNMIKNDEWHNYKVSKYWWSILLTNTNVK